jgi:hypothetical protein
MSARALVASIAESRTLRRMSAPSSGVGNIRACIPGSGLPAKFQAYTCPVRALSPNK